MRKSFCALLITVGASFSLCPAQAQAEQTPAQNYIETASGETLDRAVAHYHRSRSLLQAAIREFDKARMIADPSALLNPDEWREILVARAEELERVTSPQPAVSKSGVRFDADPALLNRGEN